MKMRCFLISLAVFSFLYPESFSQIRRTAGGTATVGPPQKLRSAKSADIQGISTQEEANPNNFEVIVQEFTENSPYPGKKLVASLHNLVPKPSFKYLIVVVDIPYSYRHSNNGAGAWPGLNALVPLGVAQEKPRVTFCSTTLQNSGSSSWSSFSPILTYDTPVLIRAYYTNVKSVNCM